MKRDTKGRFTKKPLVGLENLLIIGVVSFFAMYCLYQNVKTDVGGFIEIVEASPVSFAEVTVSEIEVSEVPVVEEVCELSFNSNNDGWVSPNELTLNSISEHDCEDKKILMKLSHYESTQRDVCNSLGYCGLFQIGAAAWSDCRGMYGITDDSQCAIKHFKINPHRFEAYTRNINSF